MLVRLVSLITLGATARRTVAPLVAVGSPGAAVPRAMRVLGIAKVGPAASLDLAAELATVAHRAPVVPPETVHPGPAVLSLVREVCRRARVAYRQASAVQAASSQAQAVPPQVAPVCQRVQVVQRQVQAVCLQVAAAVHPQVQAGLLQVPAVLRREALRFRRLR